MLLLFCTKVKHEFWKSEFGGYQKLKFYCYRVRRTWKRQFGEPRGCLGRCKVTGVATTVWSVRPGGEWRKKQKSNGKWMLNWWRYIINVLYYFFLTTINRSFFSSITIKPCIMIDEVLNHWLDSWCFTTGMIYYNIVLIKELLNLHDV